MWKLKIAEGGTPWLRTTNDHVGRQIWEFDPDLGSPEELAEIESAREAFSKQRFEKKHSADLLMRMQVFCLSNLAKMYWISLFYIFLSYCFSFWFLEANFAPIFALRTNKRFLSVII